MWKAAAYRDGDLVERAFCPEKGRLPVDMRTVGSGRPRAWMAEGPMEARITEVTALVNRLLAQKPKDRRKPIQPA